MSNLDTLLLSAEQLERFRALLAEKGLANAETGVFPARQGDQRIPLCSYQEPLWFIDRYAGGDTAHNVVYPMGLPEGDIDETALHQAICRMIERHEILRTTYRQDEDMVVQVVHEQWVPELERVDLRALPTDETEQAGWKLVDVEAAHQFDLEQGPLIRFTLLIVAPGKNVLMVSLHHIVCDTWSVAIIDREVRTHYHDIVNGRPCSLPPLERQFGDYALWQRQRVEQGMHDKDLQYWVQRLEGAAQLQLPTDFEVPEQRTHKASNCLVLVNPQLLERVKAYARGEGVTLYMTLLTAFKLMLARHTGQSDIVVGTPHSNRDLEVMRDVIGFTINSLVLRTEFDGNPTFAEAVQRVRATALEAYEHQGAPFQSIVEALHSEGKQHQFSRYSFFRCFFSVQNIQWSDIGLPQLNTGTLHDRPRFTVPHPTTKYDIYMYLRERDGKVLGGVEYDTELFAHPRIERMVSHFVRILEQGIAAPNTRIQDLAILSADDVRRQTAGWSGERRDPAQVQDLYGAFERVAAERAGQPALVDGGRTYAYRELAQASARWSASGWLQRLAPEQKVGLLADRSAHLLMAVLAVLRCGGSCVLIDRASPAARVEDMLRQHGIRHLIHDADVDVSELPVDFRVSLDALDAAEPDPNQVWRAVAGQQTAFVFMTSGSTGVPNAVELSHAGVLHGQVPQTCADPIGPGDRLLLTAPASSARLIGEVFWPLLNGATVVLARPGGHQDPAYLGQVLQRERITCFSVVPQVLDTLLDAGAIAAASDLRLVYCVGQNLLQKTAARFLLASRARLVNTYAQTEACPVAFHDCAAGAAGGSLPVGRPAPNTRVYVFDSRLQIAPVGVTGELAIAGAGLAKGYLGNPRLTAEKFVPDPFGAPGSRMYLSGDLGQWNEQGELSLRGRNDERVKIRGYRIDLQEVAQVMRGFPLVKDAVVLAATAVDGSPAIAAFFTVHAGGEAAANGGEPAGWHMRLLRKNFPVAQGKVEAPVTEQLRAVLQAKLPFYMLPAYLLEVGEVPYGRTGKIDRQALLELCKQRDEVKAGSPEAMVDGTPTTELERKLVDIWRSVLNVPAERNIGIYDSFFELGGHSLSAVNIVKRVKKQLKVQIEIRNVFEAVTIAGLRDLIEWSEGVHALEDIEL